MNKPAIVVDTLSKAYRIGLKQERFPTFRDALMNAASSPLRRLRRLGGEVGAGKDTFWALKDVSFEVQPGEVVGIIGRNGAGKSTLLKVLSRITEPTSGSARLRGRVASLLEVGTGFHAELTGRENIYLNGAILGMKRAEITRKFDEIVAFSEVEKFLDTPVKHYSSGMYVRLAFAVAAHLEPEILIVDEVLAVGDAEFQKKCLGKMQEVSSGQGRTVLFVSHNMGAVRGLCSHVILLKDGRIEVHDHTNAAINRYLAGREATNGADLPMAAATADSPGYATRLRVLALDGTTRNHFRIGEPWQAVLEFRLNASARQVTAGIGIQASDGTPIVTLHSQSRNLSRGRYRVGYRVDLPLSSQALRFAVGLSSCGRPFYYCEDVGQALIDEAAVGEQPLFTSGVGLLVSSHRPEISGAD